MSQPHRNGPSPECLSQLAIDEWNAGDTPDALREQTAAHLRGCADCRARVERTAQLSAAFFERVPDLSALTAARKQAAAAQPGASVTPLRKWPASSRGAVGAAAAALAIAAAALLMLDPGGGGSLGGEHAVSGERQKGTSRLRVYIKRGDHVLRGAEGDTVYAGDTLRFAYASARDAYLAVFGTDGGELTLYHPSAAASAQAAAPRGRHVPLDFAIELDDSLGTEKFYAVFCSEPLSLSLLRSGLSAQPAPVVPDACTLEVLSLHKEAHP